ncbi:HCL602Cp [Eremothecium sinecaudum]|uniref:HCL602Cp n=1 Tax=Eremothecium sinecaudum TaxID=45286 RepID=A0A120K1M7_9SACH|nr:HCL602Cp [Eremothecium sinecaudum]AMD19549.1 HCL602Cp [Eremothecium sinecaudum]
MPQPVTLNVKLKMFLRIAIQRLRYAQEKQQAIAKQTRRDIAHLLSQGSEHKAKYRVETLINDDMHIELLETLELYCELLHARVTILCEIKDEADLIEHHSDNGINEAVRALVYAQKYVPEVKDLQKVKELLRLKFGDDFLVAIVEDKTGVPEKVTEKCLPTLPSSRLTDLFLREIASTYEVPYSRLDNDDKNSETGDGNNVEGDESDDNKPIIALDNDEIEDRKHPITVKMPRKNIETLEKDLMVPTSIAKDVKISHKKEPISADAGIEDLRKRFAALRR